MSTDLDMVLADRPMPPGLDVKGYSHLLGECGVAFFVAPELAARLGTDFLASLDAAPMLIPGEDSAASAADDRRQTGPDFFGIVLFGIGHAFVYRWPSAALQALADEDWRSSSWDIALQTTAARAGAVPLAVESVLIRCKGDLWTCPSRARRAAGSGPFSSA